MAKTQSGAVCAAGAPGGRKVTWPTRKETVVRPLMVFIMVRSRCFSSFVDQVGCFGATRLSVSEADVMAMRWYVFTSTRASKERSHSRSRSRPYQGHGRTDRRVLVPTEEVVEMRRGRRSLRAEVLPGYVLVQDGTDDETWHLGEEYAEGHRFSGRQASRRRSAMPKRSGSCIRSRKASSGRNRRSPSRSAKQVRVCDGRSSRSTACRGSGRREGTCQGVGVHFRSATPVDLEYSQVEKV